MKVFTNEEKETMLKLLNKNLESVFEAMDKVETGEEEEQIRVDVLHPLIRLKNLFEHDIIDRLEVDERDDDKLYSL